MFKTVDLLDRLKAAYNLPSDYATAKKIGVTRQAISNYRTNGTTLDDSVAVEVAELLELEPFKVLAYMNLERAQRANNKKLIHLWQSYTHA